MPELIDDIDDEGVRCAGCGELLKDGDDVYNERDGGAIHVACCSDNPEDFYGEDEEPLKPGDPIPLPWKWSPEPASATLNSDAKPE